MNTKRSSNGAAFLVLLLLQSPAFAEEITEQGVSVRLSITVNSLSSYRVFLENCSAPSEDVRGEFLDLMKKHSAFNLEQMSIYVDGGYSVARDLHSPDCKPSDMAFWQKAYQADRDHLLDTLREFYQQ